MFLKAKILEVFTSLQNRSFKINLFSRQTGNAVQFHSGGDDYSPAADAEGLSECIGANQANGCIFAWRDSIVRKSQPGEKRIYSVKSEDCSVASEIHLKNDGNIEINSTKDTNIKIFGNASIDTSGTLTIKAGSILSDGDWYHSGNFKASHIEAEDGANGTYSNTVTSTSGIVTGGS